MITSELLPTTLGYLGGEWLSADSGDTFDVINPANGQSLCNVPRMGSNETDRAIQAAERAMNAGAPLQTRRDWLQTIGDLILEHQDELGRIITLENGKPLAEAKGEVAYAASFFHFFARKLDQLAPRRLPNTIRGCAWEIHHRPAGVVGCITPWNFPLAMMAKKVPAALGCGCAIVAKPASATPLSALALATICERAGLPAGMFNVVPGQADAIGKAICTHPAVRIISFTGSTEVGKHLGTTAAGHVKRLGLELGGNAPFIVFEDADLDNAAKALMDSKFRSAGQTCVCTNRVYVHDAVIDVFSNKVAELVANLKVGDGMTPDIDIGPMIDRNGWDKVAAHVEDALDQGATRIIGTTPSRPEHNWGCFYPPTVIRNVQPEMLVCREETFGPLVAIAQFATEQEVIVKANDTEYGLAAYLFTANRERVARLASAFRFGHVGINTGQGPTAEAPFGGMKQSGYGREGGLEGLLEYCELQTVVNG